MSGTVNRIAVLRAGMLLTITNIVAGVLGYAYQIMMGRLLSPAEFVAMNAILALGVFCASPLYAVVIVVAGQVAAVMAHNDTHFVRRLYLRSTRLLVAVWMVGLAILFAAMPYVEDYMRIPDQPSLWLFGAATGVGACVLVNGAFLQGLHRFAWLGGLGVVAAILRILASVWFVGHFDWGVRGALGGTLVSVLVVWLVGSAAIAVSIRAPSAGSCRSGHPFPLRELVPTILFAVAFAAMTQLDMVLVNHYFEPTTSSRFASAAILGKAVLYLPNGIAAAMFPMVAKNRSDVKSNSRILKQAMSAAVALCGAMVTVFCLFGEHIMWAMYGQRYEAAGGVLAQFSLAIFPMTIVVLVAHFLIALGRTFFSWLFFACAVMEVATIHFWHPNLGTVVGILGAYNTFLVLVGCCLLWLEMPPPDAHRSPPPL